MLASAFNPESKSLCSHFMLYMSANAFEIYPNQPPKHRLDNFYIHWNLHLGSFNILYVNSPCMPSRPSYLLHTATPEDGYAMNLNNENSNNNRVGIDINKRIDTISVEMQVPFIKSISTMAKQSRRSLPSLTKSRSAQHTPGVGVFFKTSSYFNKKVTV